MNYKIVSRYIKDLSYKIPNAKSYYLLDKNIKDYRVKIDVTSKRINESVLEIDTKLYFDYKKKEENDFKVSLIYSAIINFEDKIPPEQLEKIVLIEVPTSVFPDLENIISSLFGKCGFKDFKLPNMDFKKSYEDRKKN
jgi:Preprotein translocase subunit SecB|tara:strand:+ start:1086 stop:1499 length:414 start_codon:yes stop_codon:yes gene_type:complete